MELRKPLTALAKGNKRKIVFSWRLSLFVLAFFILPGSLYAALGITSPSTLPAATAGSAYSYQFQASGGVIPYSWTGTLPSWLSIDSLTGELTGLPSANDVGNHTLDVAVTDSQISVLGSFNLEVKPAPQGLTITSPSTLPAATAGSAYSFQFQASGGVIPYSWTGTLPSWLSIDSLTGELTGLPSANDVGNHTLDVAVTDSQISVLGVFSLEVEPLPSTLTTASSSSLSGVTGGGGGCALVGSTSSIALFAGLLGLLLLLGLSQRKRKSC